METRAYEALLIFATQTAEQDAAGTKSAFESTIKKQGGKVQKVTELGKRPLGHPVKKITEGFMLNYEFDLAPEKMEPLRKNLQLAEDVIKFMLIAKPKPPKAPKPRKRRAKKRAPVTAKP